MKEGVEENYCDFGIINDLPMEGPLDRVARLSNDLPLHFQ